MTIMAALLKKLLFLLYLPVIILILLEIGVRFWGYSRHYIYDPIYKEFDTTKNIPYIHKPNLINAQGRGLAVVNTDALGLRAGTSGAQYAPKKEGEYRIAILGDSVAFGEGVKRAEDTFAQVLEYILNLKQRALKVKVFNYGVSAYSVKEMVATLQYRVSDIEPDLVLLAIIPEDFEINRTPVVDRFGYTFNKKLSGFMPKDSLLKRSLRQVHLTYLIRDICYSLSAKNRNTREPVLKPAVVEDNFPQAYFYIKKFKEITERRHISSLVVLLPFLDEEFGSLPVKLEEDGITFIDLSFLTREFSRDRFMAGKFDIHPSTAVHKKIGILLSEYILESLHPLKEGAVF